MSSNIISTRNKGISHINIQKSLHPYFQWKVDLTYIMFNSDKALVGVEKQNGS